MEIKKNKNRSTDRIRWRKRKTTYIFTLPKKCWRATSASVERTMMVVHIAPRVCHPMGQQGASSSSFLLTLRDQQERTISQSQITRRWCGTRLKPSTALHSEHVTCSCLLCIQRPNTYQYSADMARQDSEESEEGMQWTHQGPLFLVGFL